MPSTHRQEVRRALQRLDAMPPAERPGALERLRANRPDLYDDVASGMRGETVSVVQGASPGGPLQEGLVLRGKYRLQRKLGQGGSGSVWLARDLSHVESEDVGPRLVAIKSSRTDVEHGDLHRDLLRKEGRLLGMLEHPHLPVVETSFEDGDRWIVVMRYIEGASLRELRQRRTEPFPIPTATPWLRDTLRVLDYLHTFPAQALDGAAARLPATPIFHRDIKPANLIRSSHGSLYVVDLGIASSGMEALTSFVSSSTGRGTPGFAAPEVDSGEGAVAQSDLYSVGMTALALLTKTHPREVRALARRTAVSLGEPDPLGVALDQSALPAWMREWIETATALRPENRFSSAAAMREALQRGGRAPRPAAASAPASAAPASVATRPNRATVLGLGAVATLALLVAVWAVARPGAPGPAPADPDGEVIETDLNSEPDPLLAASPPPPPQGVPAQSAPVQSAPATAAPAPSTAAPSRPPPATASPSAPEPAPTGGFQAVVLDPDGQPLAGASATVVGTGQGATADARGDVGVVGLAPGTYTVRVQAEGYVARDFRFEVAAGETVSRTLQFDIEDLELSAY